MKIYMDGIMLKKEKEIDFVIKLIAYSCGGMLIAALLFTVINYYYV
jgi:hypothetical protein